MVPLSRHPSLLPGPCPNVQHFCPRVEVFLFYVVTVFTVAGVEASLGEEVDMLDAMG